jgi:DNA-binding LacI/PurR family transcriptional regulator
MAARTENRRATLRDIARIAGVTPMTVSRVINEAGYVSRETREKVRAAADALDYRPNLLARSLRTRRTKTVGVLLADIANPFTAQLAHGMRQVLDPRGYTAFICLSENSAAHEQSSMKALYQHRVDGLIVATRTTLPGNESLLFMADHHLPIVQIGNRELNHPHIDRVTADHWKGGCQATEHLISLGHTEIGFVGVSLLNGSGLQRFQGFLDAMRQHSLPVREEWILGPGQDPVPGYSTQLVGYEGLSRLLAMKKRPTALFARNDMTALGIIQAARDRGLRIPGDLAIVGFDDVPLAALTSPPLTTVQQPIEEQGRRAAEILLARVESSEELPRQEIVMDCSLVIRESTVGPAINQESH